MTETTKKKKGYSNTFTPSDRSLLVISIPPVLVAAAILSFFAEFEVDLVAGAKVETRRNWKCDRKVENHKIALVDKLFVRVWCGGKGKQVGWARYTALFRQEIGRMTKQNLKDEGRGGMTQEGFKAEYFKGLDSKSEVWVVRFIFMPLQCRLQ